MQDSSYNTKGLATLRLRASAMSSHAGLPLSSARLWTSNPRTSTTMNTTATSRLDARIAGVVEFRAGDGPQIRIPEGVCQALVADDSVVLTWTEDGNPLTAAIPRIEFDRFVTEGQIVLGHAEEDAADAPKKD